MVTYDWDEYMLKNIAYIERPETAPAGKAFELSVLGLYANEELPKEYTWAIQPLYEQTILEIPFPENTDNYLVEAVSKRGLEQSDVLKNIDNINREGYLIPYLDKNEHVLISSERRSLLLGKREDGIVNVLSTAIVGLDQIPYEEMFGGDIREVKLSLESNTLGAQFDLYQEDKGILKVTDFGARIITEERLDDQRMVVRNAQIISDGLRYLLIRSSIPSNA